MSTKFNCQIVLFQAIQFSLSTKFTPIWPIDRTLSSATISGQCEPGNDGNEGIFRIPQSSSIKLSKVSELSLGCHEGFVLNS